MKKQKHRNRFYRIMGKFIKAFKVFINGLNGILKTISHPTKQPKNSVQRLRNEEKFRSRQDKLKQSIVAYSTAKFNSA